MQQKSFVSPDSIVRKIWSQADMILFIFAGSAAEFALNKEVDWLYFTGKLPKDPLGRMFSTVAYARAIIWMNEENAINTISKMKQIHTDVENSRQQKIPEGAYRDVLYMLIDATIKASEVLDRALTHQEQEEVFEVFIRMGTHMGILDLPDNYKDWKKDRAIHLQSHLAKSNFTQDLFQQFRKHLGFWRYQLLLFIQHQMAESKVQQLLHSKKKYLPSLVVSVYKTFRHLIIVRKNIHFLMPSSFQKNMKDLVTVPL
ncbi:MAG: oxygenase MpaB family protein [Bacteroidota bacterium]